ncbi:MAG: ComF family protein [Gemmatimonadaceae bacterium]
MHALKYGAWPKLADAMGERMSRVNWPSDVIQERAAVVPIPLAVVRERERGFNQSGLLARAIARRWRVREWPDVLVRSRATVTQTRLTPEGRRRNVSGAFAVPPHARRTLAGSHVILVDDVVTTGATAVECATALLDGGARIISLVTFGRAPALGDPE